MPSPARPSVAALLVLVIAAGLTLGAYASTTPDDPHEASPLWVGAEQRQVADALAATASGRSSGCGEPTPVLAGASTTLSVDVGGTSRSYLLHLPATYAPGAPTPLLLAFHGRSQSPRSLEDQSGLSDLPAVVAYPEGAVNQVGRRDWSISPVAAPGVDDEAFVRVLLARLEGRLCIDPGRVWALGHSDGAGFAVRTACVQRRRIAAVVALSGAFYDRSAGCQHPLAMLEIHGTADSIVPYAGTVYQGFVLPPVPAFVRGQAKVNGCDPEPRRTMPSPLVARFDFVGCTAGVTHLRVLGAGHSVEGTNARLDPGLDDVVLPWLLDHPLRRSPAA